MQGKCTEHPEVDATFICAECGKPYCDAHKVSHGGEAYCSNCRRLTVSVVLTRLRTWRLPATAAVIIGTAVAYSLFTGLVFAYASDVFSTFIYGAPVDRLITLAIVFVASSAFLGGIVSGVLTKEHIVYTGLFAGLLFLAVHIAVDFKFDYFELPISDSSTIYQRVIGISYYVMIAAIFGTFGGLLVSILRARGK
jgi:hypothetical protein